MSDLLEELNWRGLLHQSTQGDALKVHLASGPCSVYAGFDPTANSITIGNLVPLMMLYHCQRAGHLPVVLLGGGTGLIGDPSGKTQERPLSDATTVADNVQQIRGIFERVFSQPGAAPVKIVDNGDWLTKLTYLDVLRDVGKHFTINMMIQKDSVRERLQNREQGISYTEFSYMILQSYDFLHLVREHGISLQVGGSDQWGNIVAGVDLVRRVAHKEVFGLTAPLVTKADGTKFGKTESGAIWLSAERTSPYAYYQFWLNAADLDVERFLKIYTLLTQVEIQTVMAQHQADPAQRTAQRTLAEHATRFLHGEAGLQRALAATQALFSGNVNGLDLQLLLEAFEEAPSTRHVLSLLHGEGCSLVELLPETSLCSSKREAREFLTNGAISLNGQRASLETRLTTEQLLHGCVALLRRGKKVWHVTHWA